MSKCKDCGTYEDNNVLLDLLLSNRRIGNCYKDKKGRKAKFCVYANQAACRDYTPFIPIVIKTKWFEDIWESIRGFFKRLFVRWF